MQDITGIQKIINDKADEKLNKEIAKLSKMLKEMQYGLLRDIKFVMKNGDKEQRISLSWILDDQYPLRKMIFEARQKEYREQEAEEFIKKVEALQRELEELINQ